MLVVHMYTIDTYLTLVFLFFFSVTLAATGSGVEGNANRDLWRRICAQMAGDKTVNQHEVALYASMRCVHVTAVEGAIPLDQLPCYLTIQRSACSTARCQQFVGR